MTTKKAKAEKAPKAPAKPKAAKAPRAEKAAPADRPLSPRQIRILAALAKAPKGLNRADLAAAAEVDPTGIGGAAGYTDAEVNARPVHAGNLLNRGHVTLDGENGATVFAITPAGRAALKAANAK